jgi:hypothetical protein
MAHDDGRPDSGETSFSILMGDAAHLDGKYTVFGEVERGDEVLRAIASAPRDSHSRPLRRIGVNRALVVPAAQLAEVYLKPAMRPHPAPERTRVAPLPFTAWVLVFVGVMMALGIATFVAAGRASPRVAASLGLLVALVGFYICFALWSPVASLDSGVGAVALFVGSLATFKMMGRFESPRRGD